MCFQLGGGGAASSGMEIGVWVVRTFGAERLVVPVQSTKVYRLPIISHWPGEVEIVSKTCVYFGMKRSVIELLVVRGMLK